MRLRCDAIYITPYITLARKESPFITALIKDQNLEVRNIDGTESVSDIGHNCREGFLVQRKSKHGPFYGCSKLPRRKHVKRASRKPVDASFESKQAIFSWSALENSAPVYDLSIFQNDHDNLGSAVTHCWG